MTDSFRSIITSKFDKDISLAMFILGNIWK